MKLPLYKTVIGVRHRRLFAFSTNAGRLIDHLVSEFPKKKDDRLYFSRVGWKIDHMGARLSNDDGNFSIDLDVDGLALTYNYYLNDSIDPEILATKFDEMLPRCLKILESSKFVNRIGIINYYAFEKQKNAAANLADRLLKVQLSGLADSFNLRFALKNPTMDTLVRTDKVDYTNVIFTFSSERPPESEVPPDVIDVNVDYQIYFTPERTFTSEMITDHFRHFEDYLRNQKIEELLDYNPAGVAHAR